MAELIFFMLGSVFALLVVGSIIIHKEDKELYDRVQKRNEERNEGVVYLNSKTGQYES